MADPLALLKPPLAPEPPPPLATPITLSSQPAGAPLAAPGAIPPSATTGIWLALALVLAWAAWHRLPGQQRRRALRRYRENLGTALTRQTPDRVSAQLADLLSRYDMRPDPDWQARFDTLRYAPHSAAAAQLELESLCRLLEAS